MIWPWKQKQTNKKPNTNPKSTLYVFRFAFTMKTGLFQQEHQKTTLYDLAYTWGCPIPNDLFLLPEKLKECPTDFYCAQFGIPTARFQKQQNLHEVEVKEIRSPSCMPLLMDKLHTRSPRRCLGRGHFQSHAYGTGSCCQQLSQTRCKPWYLAEVSKAEVLLLLGLLSVKKKSNMDSWLLSSHSWEKSGPAELCPLPREQKK